MSLYILPHHLLFLPLSLTDSGPTRQPFFLLAHTSWPPVHPAPCPQAAHPARPHPPKLPRLRAPPPEAALLRVARPPRTHARAAAGSARLPLPRTVGPLPPPPRAKLPPPLLPLRPREPPCTCVCLLHLHAAEPAPLPGLARWSRRRLLLCARAARRVRRIGEEWGRHRKKGLEGRRPGEPNLSTFQGESLESSFQELIPHPATRFIPLS